MYLQFGKIDESLNDESDYLLLRVSFFSFGSMNSIRGLNVLGPVQMINVWPPNTIKHCLVTKHANVEVSGQTVKTCLIKHR